MTVDRTSRPATEQSGLQRSLSRAAVAFSALILTGCQMLSTTSLLDASGATCQSATGEYYLPKKNITIVVHQDPTNNFYTLKLDQGETVADRSQAYCLDFLSSITSDDLVVVNRQAGLLQSIRANTADQSAAIISTVIDAAAAAATGDPNGVPLRAGVFNNKDLTEIANYAFDPFDRYRLAQINDAISTYGFCVFVEEQTVVRAGYAEVQRYCDHPSDFVKSSEPPELPLGASTVGLDAKTGILYRSNRARRIDVMRRRDPGSGKPWGLYTSKLFEMPNEAPIFSVSVDRSFFVTRETNLTFNNGVLTDVQIKKPSEALVVAQLTLKLAQTIVAIPGQIIRVRVQAENNTRALIDAQNQLIYNEIQYQNTLTAKNTKTPIVAAAPGTALAAAIQPANASAVQLGKAALAGATPEVSLAVEGICKQPGMKAICSGPKYEACKQSPDQPTWQTCMAPKQ
jgi:hypothetical protein